MHVLSKLTAKPYRKIQITENITSRDLSQSFDDIKQVCKDTDFYFAIPMPFEL